MHQTKNDLSVAVRGKAVDLLNARLADALDLMLQSKQAHWNVRGQSFVSLHALFDQTAEDIEQFADLMAERAAQLGGTAEGTARIVAQRSKLDEYPLRLAQGNDHTHAVANAIARFGKLCRAAIAESSHLEDADTADLFTEVSRGTDKLLWMLEVQLADQSGEPSGRAPLLG